MLDALRHRLMDPELFARVRGRVHRRVEPAAGEAGAGLAGQAQRAGRGRRRIERLIRAIEEGLYEPSMKERMQGAGAAARGARGRAGRGDGAQAAAASRPGRGLPAEGGGPARGAGGRGRRTRCAKRSGPWSRRSCWCRRTGKLAIEVRGDLAAILALGQTQTPGPGAGCMRICWCK